MTSQQIPILEYDPPSYLSNYRELYANDPRQPHLPGVHGGATWGYNKSIDGHHLKVDDVKIMLGEALLNNYNLLLNIGPLPDGSVHPEDIETLSKLVQ